MEISIKKPCHENWEQMSPNEQGAFCGKCVKTVIDFSSKSIDEIREYFAIRQSEKVCGRFQKEQLTVLSFDAFFNEFKGFNFTKRLAVILYFTFGMCLFNTSTGMAQTTGHEKGDVEINIDHALMGGIRANPIMQDTVKPCLKPKPKSQAIKGKIKVTHVNSTEVQESVKMGEVMAIPKKRKYRKK